MCSCYVRSATMAQIVDMVRKAGARKVSNRPIVCVQCNMKHTQGLKCAV
jgi:glutamine phosphoribosylpyrophosphate amidotransferase